MRREESLRESVLRSCHLLRSPRRGARGAPSPGRTESGAIPSCGRARDRAVDEPHADRMSLTEAIRSKGGIVRTLTLRDAGWSSRSLSQARASGAVIRPRNGWLALPDADPELVQASAAGVVLTCVTQARRAGLWVLREDRPHVAADGHSGRVRISRDPRTNESLARIHWAKPLVAREPDALVDPVENVLATVATCLPFEEALIIWESALRKRLVHLPAVRRMPLPQRARRVADAASPFSDSGLETLVPVRLRWMGVRIIAQAWIAGHRVDFLIGERLVLQIDGATHVGPQREEDIRHDAALMLLGFHVIRVGYRDVVDGWPAVQDLIMRAVAEGLHLAG